MAKRPLAESEDNRRRHERLYEEGRILLTPVGGKISEATARFLPQDYRHPPMPQVARLLDVSAAGMRILVSTEQYISGDVMVQAKILQDAGIDQVMATVVWQNRDTDGIYAGLELEYLPKPAQARLWNLIRSKIRETAGGDTDDAPAA